MHTSLTYCPPIPQTRTKCPHTYGVRVGPCRASATEPCRPTACTMPSPYPSTDHCSLLGYRYVSPNGDGFPLAYSVTHSHTDHSSLITAHSSYTFSAKERDSETGLSYFGARYYSSDLSIWLSVDPMSGKYPSLSPYIYCANNPVKLVDPNGEKVLPSAAFQDSKYYYVFKNLSQTNKTYQNLLSKYQDDTHDFLLDYSTEVTHKAGSNQMSYNKTGNKITNTKASSKYYRPYGIEQSEIAMVQTLLHEAIHAVDGLTQRETPNHNGFDQASVFSGLKEYNSAFNLGYSDEDLEILSWSGLQESEEYHDFIKSRAKENNRTFDEEDRYVKSRITIIMMGADLNE